MKYLLLFLILAIIVSCGPGETVQILPGACEAESMRGFTITGSDDESELCLVTGSEQEVIDWVWSEDGSVFAYALQDVTVTRPAFSGRTGYYRPPATNWYIADGDGSDVRRFPLGDNNGLRFSPDGKYAIVQIGCYYTTCQHTVYEVRNNRRICEYETRTVWMGETDCPVLTLENGQTWDIREMVTNAGCVYYERSGWSVPDFCATATPTPYPGNTPP